MAKDVRSARNLRKVVAVNSLAPKAGSMAIIQERPCQITFAKNIRSGKCGGAAKVKLRGTDLITGKNLEETFSDSRRVRIPDVLRQSTELIDVDEDTNCASVITEQSDVIEDVMLSNEEMRGKLLEAFQSGALIKLSIMSITTIEDDERVVTHIGTEFSILEKGNEPIEAQYTQESNASRKKASDTSSAKPSKAQKVRAPVSGNRMRKFYDKPASAVSA